MLRGERQVLKALTLVPSALSLLLASLSYHYLSISRLVKSSFDFGLPLFWTLPHDVVFDTPELIFKVLDSLIHVLKFPMSRTQQ